MTQLAVGRISIITANGTPIPTACGLARRPVVQLLLGLTLCGISFGYIEAAVVVYLRGFYEPLHQRLYPDRAPGDLLPLIPLEDSLGNNRTVTELGRELATLLLLAGVALSVARNRREWLAAFVFVFGLWDLWYYAFLKVLIDWPASLLTWDILFLVPVPWVAPVLAPALVALTMVLGGAAVLWRERLGQPLRARPWDWCWIVVGGGIIWLSFCWDHASIAAGHHPAAFAWPMFAVGLGIAGAGFVQGWLRKADGVHGQVSRLWFTPL